MAQSRPTIAHLLHTLTRAGAELLAADLARKLQDRFNFIFICLDEIGPLGKSLQEEGFIVTDLHRRPGVDFSVARRVRQLVKKHDVKLLHAHQYSPFFYAASSRSLLETVFCRPPVLFTEHGRHFPDHRSLRRVLANKVLLTRHDRVTAVGQFVKDALTKNEGIPGRRIEVIYNGIDPDSFGSATYGGDSAKATAIRMQLRSDLGLKPDTPMALQVARLHPVKDHVTAVAAMAYVVQDIPEAVLVLVGEGVEQNRIIAKINEFGLKDNIRMVGMRKDVARFMLAADVYLLSSLSEGVSVTLLEAMGSSLPIVATDVGGNGEVVSHGKNGLLCKSGDPRDLAGSLISLLRNRQMQSQMGRAGRTRLREMFTQERMHAGYTRVYEQMLGRKGD
jgi:glycosyltransferase involved in cell wall biosynthesis